MAKPKISDLVTYINKALTGLDWNTNFQKIVNWLSLGTTDIKVNKIETNEIENNGTFQQNGNLIATSVQANTITSNNFVGDGSNLTNIRVSNTFSYTPFSINSAKANFIINDTTKLTFDVDENNPLTVTTAKGVQIKIISINDFDVSGLNGTYYIFVDEETNGGTVYLKSCTIYRQTTEPTGQNGDVWLDTSNEPFICREKVSNNWYSDEYNKVPVGKVVVSGGTITSLTMLPFNSNGANAVFDGKYSNDEQIPSVIVKYSKATESDTERRNVVVFSNGFCIQFIKTPSGTEYTWTFDIAYAVKPIVVAVLNNEAGGGSTDSHIKVNPSTTNCVLRLDDETTGFLAIAVGFIG